MKKLLTLATIAACALPTFAFAAFNDVTLTISTVLSIGGIEVDVSGSSATIQSIVVNASSFDVIMQSGSSMTVTAPNRNQMSVTSASNVSSTVTCTNSNSSIALTATGSGTVTVTPSSTLCTTTASSGSSGGGNGPIVGSYGVVNSGSYSPPIAGTTTSTTISQTPEPPQAPPGTTANLPLSPSFKRDLQIGSTGSDVKSLQIYLNAHGFILASDGPGSPGNETLKFGRATRAALIRLQIAAGIKPAAGYFGPKTRAYVATHPQSGMH